MNSGYAPHRGVLILVFGVLGLVVCQLLSPFAWIMGKADMDAIDQGRMDPEGRGLTQAGMICGIVGTIILILSLVAVAGVLLFAIVGAAAQQ